MARPITDQSTLLTERQEVCPYQLAQQLPGSERKAMARRGDYLRGRWFWQEPHVRFIAPDTVYDMADTCEANNATPDEQLQREDLHHWLCQLVRTLPKRDRAVMKIRYGLADGRACSLRETGLLLGISPERVRQIEARVIHRFKRRLGLLPRRSLPEPTPWKPGLPHLFNTTTSDGT